MPLSHEWWAGDNTQKYWLEITDRPNLGEDLLSPKFSSTGKITPGYESMVHVMPGDVILHYWQQAGQEPALVSYSIALSEAWDSDINWVARGKNAHGKNAKDSDAWQVSLGEMTDLQSPLTLSVLRERESSIKGVLEALQMKHGDPIYFPFRFSKFEPMRANQVYLTKFPRELVDLLPELNKIVLQADTPVIGGSGGTNSGDIGKPLAKVGKSGTGYLNNQAAKKAIELQAMKQATEYLEGLGMAVKDVSATESFDLSAVIGDSVWTVEVKGSSGVATSVELTIGEVKASWSSVFSALIVVDQISWVESANSIQTSPGRLRIIADWLPEEERLLPTRYRYVLPVMEEPTPDSPAP